MKKVNEAGKKVITVAGKATKIKVKEETVKKAEMKSKRKYATSKIKRYPEMQKLPPKSG